jgi:hypothetical protein
MSENDFISYADVSIITIRVKYFLHGSLRYDGISSLPEPINGVSFPGGSVGWTVTKEPFMTCIVNVLSDLKFRVPHMPRSVIHLIGNYPYLGL